MIVTIAAAVQEPSFRILHVLYYYAPYTSGLTVYAERLSRELVARGYEITVLAARHDRSLPAREVLDGVVVRRLPVAVTASRAVIVPKLMPTALALLRRHDILHLHLPLAEAAPLAAAARLMGKRVIATHNADLDLSESRFERLGSAVALSSGLIAGRIAHRVLTNTHDRGRVSPLIRRLGSNVSVIAPPIEIPAPSEGARNTIRARFALEPGPVIGFVGRPVVEKGIDVLATAMPMVQDRFPLAVLALAGPDTGTDGRPFMGPWDDQLNRLGAAIRRLGPLDVQDLADFFSACDVLVLPSTNWTETFGMVQVEAMLCGTPVVASDLPGVREPITRTGMGRIARAGDAGDLASALCDVIANRVQFVRTPDVISSLYSLKNTVDTYAAVYRGERGEPLER
jgi:glycosyltransferase involved in cell wall biosynthesis